MSERDSTPKPISTAKQLDTLKPKSDRYEIADAGCSGLRIRVLPTGKKNFVWYARSQGKRHVVAVGTYPDISLADARKKLEVLKDQHKEGALFNDEIQAPKTVSQLAELFYQDDIKVNRTEGGAKQARMALDKYIIPGIGTKKLAVITPLQVGSVVQTVVKNGYPSRAETVLGLMKQMFTFAVGRGFILQSPAYALKKKHYGAKTGTGDRVLDAEDIQAFWSALDKAPRMSAPVRTALRILLLSGVRSGELRLAQWKDVDLINKEWFIPEENSKTTAWTVPLSSHLIKQFTLLYEYAGGSPYVVPGKDKEDKDGNLYPAPVSDKVLNRAMSRLFEIKDNEGNHILTIDYASPHDLRRTMRSKLDDFGIEPHIAEKCLNHSLGKIEEIYNKNKILNQRRDALEKWGDYVDLLVTPRENVRVLSA